MPAEGHGVCVSPGRHPQREDADHDAAEVSEEMSCVRHDGQTVSGVSTCREEERKECVWSGLKEEDHP